MFKIDKEKKMIVFRDYRISNLVFNYTSRTKHEQKYH